MTVGNLLGSHRSRDGGVVAAVVGVVEAVVVGAALVGASVEPLVEVPVVGVVVEDGHEILSVGVARTAATRLVTAGLRSTLDLLWYEHRIVKVATGLFTASGMESWTCSGNPAWVNKNDRFCQHQL
jgi:hypothetical protein